MAATEAALSSAIAEHEKVTVELAAVSVPSPTTEQVLEEIATLKEQVSRLENAVNSKPGIEQKTSALFDGSTHSYLIYSENASLTRIIVAVIVLGIQLLLLIIMLLVVQQLLAKDLVNVHITYQDCTDKAQGQIDVLDDQLVCDADEETMEYATLSFILMACFVMSDFFSCCEVLLNADYTARSKVGAVFILIENMFAAFVASLFAFQGVFTGSGYDALVNTVGILFIHDLDEKVYDALEVVNKATISCKCFCCLQQTCRKYSRLIYVLLFVGFIVAIGYISIEIDTALDPDDDS